MGYSALRAGIGFIPFVIALGIGLGLSSTLVSLFPPRVLVIGGGILVLAAMLYGSTLNGGIPYFPNLEDVYAVALGIGTAFVSTVYGLALANLLLLPAAHRIRASVAETFDLEEMMVEGGLCLFDGIHPSLVRERLNNFLRTTSGK